MLWLKSSFISFNFLFAFLIAAIVASLSIGSVPIRMFDLLDGTATELEWTVLFEIRTPRVILAGFVGAALALAGAALQGLFRNPLADPGLIGVSSGAALGAIAMIVLGSGLNLLPELMPYALPVAAVLGALTVTIFLYLFASYYGQFSILTVILLGIAINALASVGIGAFQYLSDDAQLRSLVFWMMGSFGRASWEIVMPAMAIVIISLVLLLSQTKNLDRLQLGEAEAWFLGVDVKKLKRLIILSVSAAVGAGVSISGIIGFVGLVVPHIVRLVLGSSHRLVLPGSVLIGATLMIIADLISRILHSPAEIPISLVTSAIGAPFFLWLISRTRPS